MAISVPKFQGSVQSGQKSAELYPNSPDWVWNTPQVMVRPPTSNLRYSGATPTDSRRYYFRPNSRTTVETMDWGNASNIISQYKAHSMFRFQHLYITLESICQGNDNRWKTTCIIIMLSKPEKFYIKPFPSSIPHPLPIQLVPPTMFPPSTNFPFLDQNEHFSLATLGEIRTFSALSPQKPLTSL